MSLFGVYIHYPYCRKLCPYCDFAVSVARPEPERYLEAVLAELDERAPDLAGRQLISIYFGGGTPSLWPAAQLQAVVGAIRAHWPGRGQLEVTLEANPADCTPEAMAAWQRAGINRLSIGVQSGSAAELSRLGRDHRQGDGPAAVKAALAAGFQSLSADVIFGVPGGRAGAAPATEIAELEPPHLSVYELSIEPRTFFGKWARSGTLIPRDPDQLADDYLAIHDQLTARGYQHYEISSYARPGHRAVHNGLYWSGGEFLGLGAGAASFVRDSEGGGRRWTNLRSAPGYLRARGSERVAAHERESPEELARTLLWLGLRTTDGVAAELAAPAEAVVQPLLARGLLERSGGRIRPTIRGFLMHDRIARAVAAQC